MGAGSKHWEAAGSPIEIICSEMGHELRTPMNSVLGAFDLLLAERVSPRQRDLLETAKMSAESLLARLNDLLDLAKIEAGKMEPEEAPFSVRQTITDVMRLLSEKARAKSVNLQVSIDPSVPESVSGDAAAFTRILTTVLSAGLRHTERGGLSVRCTASSGSGPGRIALSVEISDTGVAMSQELCDHLFEVRYDTEWQDASAYAAGLGLPLCARLAELMGGSMEVRSDPGKGNTLILTVDLAVHEQTGAVPSSGRGGARKKIATGALRILLAEDNPINQKIMNGMLAKDGHEVFVASNGSEAVGAIRRGSYDLVLMDVQMPVMDGVAAVLEIRRLEQALDCYTPVVALTAHTEKADRERCLDAGMDGYLTKPVSLENLRQALDLYGRQLAPA